MNQLQRLLEQMGPEAVAHAVADAAARLASTSNTISTKSQHQQQEEAASAASFASNPSFIAQLANLILPSQQLTAFISPPCFEQGAASPLPRHNRLSVTSSTFGMPSPQQQQQEQVRAPTSATAYSWLPVEAACSLPRANIGSNRYTPARLAAPMGSPPAAAPAAPADSVAGAAATSARFASLLGNSSSSSCAQYYSESQALSCSSLDNSLQGMLLAQHMDPTFASQLAAPQPLSGSRLQHLSHVFGLLGTASPASSAAPLSQLSFAGQASNFTHPMAHPTFDPSSSFAAQFAPITAQDHDSRQSRANQARPNQARANHGSGSRLRITRSPSGAVHQSALVLWWPLFQPPSAPWI